MYTDTFPSTLLTAKDYAKLLKKIGFRKVYYYNKWSLQSKTLFPRKYKTKVIVAKK